MKIGLVGIGRLGTQLAKSFLMAGNKVFAYHKNEEKVVNFSNNLESYGDIKLAHKIRDFKDNNVEVIVMALPPEETIKISKDLKKIITEKQWVINTATEVYLTDLYSEFDQHKVVAAKIIGNAHEIKKGEIPGVIIDGKDKILREKTEALFSRFAYTVSGDERKVSTINKIGAIEAIRTVLRIEKRLEENNLNLDDNIYTALLSNVVAGTVKTYSRGNIGPFLEKLITQLKKETLK